MGGYVVDFVVQKHLGRVQPAHRQVVSDVRQRVGAHLQVGLYAAAVAYLAASGCVEHLGQAVRYVFGVAAAGVAVVDGLYAAAAGYVVFAGGQLQLAVVREVHGQLHEALAVGARADDYGAVQVLQAAAGYLARARAFAVHDDDYGHHRVDWLHAGHVVVVGALELAARLH